MLAAAWLTAAATGLLALFAIITAWYARKAFQEQSREVNLLQQQAEEQQAELRRQADDRRRAQAARVYVTGLLEPEHSSGGRRQGTAHSSHVRVVAAMVHNTSAQPVYGVKIHWMDLDSAVQAGDVDRLGTIGPGEQRRASKPVPDGVQPDRFAPIVFFRDAAVQRWTVTRAGHLAPVAPELPDGAPQIGTTAVTGSPFWTTGPTLPREPTQFREWMPTNTQE